MEQGAVVAAQICENILEVCKLNVNNVYVITDGYVELKSIDSPLVSSSIVNVNHLLWFEVVSILVNRFVT